MKRTPYHLMGIAELAVGIVILASIGCSNPTSTPAKEFDSGPVAVGGHFEHVFGAAKTIAYHCIYHGGPGGVGMSGTLIVAAGGTAKRDTIQMNEATFSPVTLNATVGDTVVWVNGSSMAHTATSDN